MFEHIYGIPEHCEKAVVIARDCIRGLRFHNILNVVIVGMGGSAIGADLVRMLTRDRSMISITICRDYKLPAFVDEKTLVISSSYSGNTEETLTAYEQARKKKAKTLVITTGGELIKRATADEVPVILIPSGLQPRAAIGYSLLTVIVVLEEQGIVPRRFFNVDAAIGLLKQIRDRFSPDNPDDRNPPKTLARRLFGKIPVIYGITGITDAVALRWKCQINENAKHPAFFNMFPELTHNEIMGFEGDDQILKKMEIVILRDPDENKRAAKQIAITADLIRDKVAGISEIWPEGDSHLERTLFHVMYGDYVSAYLALLNKKDPSEINLINALKERMKL
jgi:glucose/mannose-6-phosphate isomerase